MAALASVEILTGVGTLWVAPLGTAFPADPSTTPGAGWVDLGETQDGVTITYDEDVTEIEIDQETGPVKAIRSKESLTVETKLVRSTLENMVYLNQQTVTTATPLKTIGSYKGASITEYAFMFRGNSAYAAGQKSQYQITRGYFKGPVTQEFAKDSNVAMECTFVALVDMSAATNDLKFGKLIHDTVV